MDLNFAQGFVVREFPRGSAEIGIIFERLARGFRSRESKMAIPPPETQTTHSGISPDTQATPWHEITLTLYGDSSFETGTFI